MDSIFGSLRFAMRSFRRSPAFTVVVVATIAIAIGATTTVLSVVNAALVRPLPFQDSERIVIGQGFVRSEGSVRGLSYQEAMDWRAMSRAFDGLAAYDAISLNLAGGDGDPLRARSEIVSEDYFRVLGANAARGRTFLPEEQRAPDAHPVAVISHDLWQSRFAGEAVVGRSVTLNARPFTIVGVMPPGFRGTSFASEVWIPMMMVSTIRPVSMLESRGNRWLGVVGRMKPGVTVEDAQSDLDRVAAALERAHPATNSNRGAQVTAMKDFQLGTTENLLVALFAAVSLLLLSACANVMNLQIVRSAARRREMALRTALGAGRGEIARQLLVEGALLSAAGAACGILLAAWGVDALLALAPPGLLPAYAEPSIDGVVLLVTTLIAAAAGVAIGLAPALSRASGDLVTALKEGAPSAAAGLGSMRRVRAQQVLVVGEVALALVLLAGASLMVQSMRRQLDVDLGFAPAGVLAARLELPRDRYGAAERAQFAGQVVERLEGLPGVASVAVAADLPLRGITSGGYLTHEVGADETPYMRHRVTPEFFETLGIRLDRGRAFDARDGEHAPAVAIVSATMARRLWPDRDAVGQRISLAGTSGPLPWVEVIGVAADVRYRDLTSDLATPTSRVDVYFPFAQQTDETLEIAVRVEEGREPTAMVAGLRRELLALDPALPVYDVAPLAASVAQQTATARFGSLMLSIFSAIAVVLAGVGIYGLLAFVVSASGREIAIRMALGAASGSVLALVLRKGMTLAVAGGAIGLLLTVPGTRLLSSLLFGVEVGDPRIMGGVTLALLVLALLACWFPARRASRIAPHAALKSE